MTKNQFVYTVFSIFLGLFTGTLLYVMLINSDLVVHRPRIEILLDVDRASLIEVFVEEDGVYEPNSSTMLRWKDPVEKFNAILELPDLANPGKIRIDFGVSVGKWKIRKITLVGLNKRLEFTADSIFMYFKPVKHIGQFRLSENEYVEIITSGHDAYIESIFQLNKFKEDLFNNRKIFNTRIFLIVLINTFFLIIASRFLLLKTNPLKNILFIQAIFIVTFVLIIILPLLAMIVNPVLSTEENRNLSSKPVFSTSKMFEYPKQFNEYFSDNLGFRQILTTIHSYLRFKLFNSSSQPHKVMVGKKSWLYSTDPEIAGDFRNITRFTDEELLEIQRKLEELHQWYEARGTKFYVIIPPSKYRIYPEFLPRRFSMKPYPSKLDQVEDYLKKNSKVTLITVHDELMKAKKDVDVFYAHDTHWNFMGGYIGYQKIMNYIIQDFPFMSTLRLDDSSKTFYALPRADLAKILALHNFLLNDEWIFNVKSNSIVKECKIEEYKTVNPLSKTICFENNNNSLPRLVMYRDSFTNLLIPYLTHHFSRSVFLWTYDHSLEVYEKEKPDVVIMEIVEYRIDKLLEKNPEFFSNN